MTSEDVAPNLALISNGRRYGGWKGIRVTQSIETLAGSFALEVSDRWGGQAVPWPLAEEDTCRVEIEHQVVIDGFVSRRRHSMSATSRSLSYSGYDRAQKLVKNSARLNTWTFNNVDITALARAVARPFGCPVSVQPGLKLPPADKVVLNPGDSAYEAIHRAAARVDVLMMSDSTDGILITRAGTSRATPLIMGENVKSFDVEYDSENRYREYEVATQVAGLNDDEAGTSILAKAVDQGVRSLADLLIIRPDQGLNLADAQRRADWEARVRAARAETVTIGVQGWTQPSGELWPLNALVRVKVPGVNGDMLISQVEHSIGDEGQQTSLHLVRPDAFTPEPIVREAGAWKELAGGAK